MPEIDFLKMCIRDSIYSDIYHLICQILSEYEKDSFLSEAVIYARMLDILSLIGRYQMCIRDRYHHASRRNYPGKKVY